MAKTQKMDQELQETTEKLMVRILTPNSNSIQVFLKRKYVRALQVEMGRNEDLDRELRVEKDNFAQSIRSLRRQLLVAQADIEKLRKENSDKVASQSDLEKVILIYIDIDTGLSN